MIRFRRCVIGVVAANLTDRFREVMNTVMRLMIRGQPAQCDQQTQLPDTADRD